MRKVYARQINPEWQESPAIRDLEDADCYTDILIMPGNRYFRSHNTDHPAYRHIMDYYDEMANEWENAGAYYESDNWTIHRPARKPITLAELLHDYHFERPDGKPWTTKQRHAWKLLMESDHGAEDEEIYLPVLELLTGYKWDTRSIHGCCQGDYAEIIYRTDAWDRESINHFETEYFNLGSEWEIHDGDNEPEEPEDISGYCMYCVSWDHDGIREEIAREAGCKPEDVVLFCWTGEVLEYKYRTA